MCAIDEFLVERERAPSDLDMLRKELAVTRSVAENLYSENVVLKQYTAYLDNLISAAALSKGLH